MNNNVMSRPALSTNQNHPPPIPSLEDLEEHIQAWTPTGAGLFKATLKMQLPLPPFFTPSAHSGAPGMTRSKLIDGLDFGCEDAVNMGTF